MKQINEEEMLAIMGGATNKECDKLAAEANMHVNDPTFDWDRWADAYEKTCSK